jgi:hypothetical protein
MQTLRILLCGTDSWRKSTLRELTQTEEDLEIVDEVETPLDLLLQTKNIRPQVVVLSQLEAGGEPGICSHLLLECPNVVVLLLPAHPGVGGLSWMVLCKETVLDASQGSLRSALRKACTFVSSGTGKRADDT